MFENHRKEIVGAFCAIIAIPVAFLIYGMQSCDSIREKTTDLFNDLEAEKIALNSINEEIVALGERRESIEKYIFHEKLHKDVGVFNRQASRAIEKIGGKDVNGWDRNDWRQMLTNEGIDLHGEMGDMMGLLNDSVLTQLTPTILLLHSPFKTAKIVNGLRDWWVANHEKNSSKIHSILIDSGSGSGRTSDTIKLLERASSQNTEKITSMEVEGVKTRKEINRYETHINNSDTPKYCNYL
jgi:hypothetical protein